eukprot:5773346-Prymnesium_polylepis.1
MPSVERRFAPSSVHVEVPRGLTMRGTTGTSSQRLLPSDTEVEIRAITTFALTARDGWSLWLLAAIRFGAASYMTWISILTPGREVGRTPFQAPDRVCRCVIPSRSRTSSSRSPFFTWRGSGSAITRSCPKRARYLRSVSATICPALS